MNPVAVLRPNVRHLLIVAAFFALMLGVLVPLVRHLGTIGVIQPYLMILVLSPWLLGILVLAIDRPSPVKYWAAPLLLSLIAPALAVGHDWLIIRSWMLTGGPPDAVVTLLLEHRPDHPILLLHPSHEPAALPRLRPARHDPPAEALGPKPEDRPDPLVRVVRREVPEDRRRAVEEGAADDLAGADVAAEAAPAEGPQRTAARVPRPPPGADRGARGTPRAADAGLTPGGRDGRGLDVSEKHRDGRGPAVAMPCVHEEMGRCGEDGAPISRSGP